VKCDRLTAVGADLPDQFVELLHPAGAERHREPTAGEVDRRGGTDAR
jgi:hypothetical protein